LNLTRNKAYNLIAFLFGGRAAEELIFKDFTTGAGNDIERATELARRMVCEWGMSDVLGPITFGKKEEAIFLGREIAQHRDYSEQTAQTIDREVRDIVERNYRRAREILSTKIQTLHDLANALLEFETLTGEEVETVCQGRKIKRVAPTPAVAPTTEQDKAGNGGGTPAPVPA
jgi:cell division protease FtsH